MILRLIASSFVPYRNSKYLQLPVDKVNSALKINQDNFVVSTTEGEIYSCKNPYNYTCEIISKSEKNTLLANLGGFATLSDNLTLWDNNSKVIDSYKLNLNLNEVKGVATSHYNRFIAYSDFNLTTIFKDLPIINNYKNLSMKELPDESG